MTRWTWTAGVLLGVLDGILFFAFPILGLGLLSVATVLALRDRARAAGIAGLLVGLGGCWTFFLVRATLECDAFNRIPNQGCVVFGLDPYLALAVVLLLVGAGLTVVAIRSRTATGRASHRGEPPEA